MADIKQIQVGSTIYDINDATKLPLTGGTLTGNVKISNRTNGNQQSFDATYIENNPIGKYVWHDVQKFNHYGYTYEYTTDGSTWTAETSSNYDKLFSGRDNNSVTVITADRLGCRFTVGTTTAMTWSLVAAILINYSWTATVSDTSIKVEVLKTDGTVASTVDYAAGSYAIAQRLLWHNSLSGNKSLRITILKTTNTSTGVVNLSGIKCLATRLGDQGLGTEYEYPYQADADMKIYPWTNNVQDLGTSSYKWKSVYATTFVGALSGNAATATKATQDESGNNIKASYAASMSISDHTITLKNKNAGTLSTVTVPDNDTLNTTGTSEKLTTKLYLAGGETQSATGVVTYSNSKCYVGTDNKLYSNDEAVLTLSTLPVWDGTVN